MKQCKKCGMYIHGHHRSCPLCAEPVCGGITGSSPYPLYRHKVHVRKKGQQICVKLSVTVIGLLLLINILTYQNVPVLWSLNVAAPILYVWLLVKNTVQSKLPAGAKLLIQLLGMSLMFVVFDATSGFYGWSVNYLIPFMVLVTTLVVTAIMMNADIGWERYISYTISMVFVGFIPILLLACGLSGVLWTALMCTAYSSATLLFLYMVKRYVLTQEIARRFYA